MQLNKADQTNKGANEHIIVPQQTHHVLAGRDPITTCLLTFHKNCRKTKESAMRLNHDTAVFLAGAEGALKEQVETAAAGEKGEDMRGR